VAAQGPAVLHTEVNPANGHTYHLLDVSNWSDARAEAQALGGDLVVISDQAENDWVFLTFAQWGGVPRHLWIGLTDEVVEGTFVWVDGTPLSYTNWNWQEPNNSLANDPVNGEDYVTAYPSGEWLDLHDTNYSQWFSNLCGVVEITGPSLTLTGSCPGPATLTAANLTPNSPVVFGYAFSTARSVLAGGACAGTTLPVTAPTLLGTLFADGAGVASLPGNIPAGACGTVTVLAFDVVGCQATNTIAL
jgi:hypothetical protein